MKKNLFIIIISLSLLLTSCDGGLSDDMVSVVMKTEQNHLNNYNKIRRITNDTVVVHYVDSLKKQYVKDAYEVKGSVESNVGLVHGSLKKSLSLIDTYIDSLK